MTKKELQDLSRRLAAEEPRVRAIYVSTYIPRECGIATFTKDLTNAINILNPSSLADIIAIDDAQLDNRKYNYPWEVKLKIHQPDLRSWLNAAEYINQSGAEIVNLQHEFGIYGRPDTDGEYAVPFVEAITKPLVVTFHTVLPNPSNRQRDIIKRIAKRADAIVVMVETAVHWLTEVYGVDERKIVVIHHGVPDIPFTPTAPAKKQLGFNGYNTIMGFGLLSEGKGYEQAIAALPEVLQKHPKTKLLILGETHPVVARQEGERYRDSLKKLAKELGVSEAVVYVDRYLTLDEIVEYLKATDIYITPYHNLDQITSGTLAYAVGAGKACISTPYLYAKEVIDDKRGILVEPKSTEQFAQAVNRLLDKPSMRQEMATNAYAYGRNMIWPSVALRYLDLFEILVENRSHATVS